MLLHVYVGDVRLDFAADKERISGFTLIIKQKETEHIYRMTSMSYNAAIIRFHQTCHIPIEQLNAGELSFEIMCVKREGILACVGIASCLTSVIENHAMKILQLETEHLTTIGKLSVTLAYQQTVKTLEEENKNLQYIFQNRILSQREYNFLLSRRFNWPGDRPSTWNKEYEEYLKVDPGLVLKDIYTSTINPINRPCRDSKGPKIDFIGQAFDRKLRQTNKAVGYVGVSWPDNKLYG
jgi:hypothetical protein